MVKLNLKFSRHFVLHFVVICEFFLLLSLRGAATPPHGSVTVFQRGEEGYFCVKIPSLLTTQNGTLLAFGEARKGSCSDLAWTDLVVKRSINVGKTWSRLAVIWSNSSEHQITQVGNAAPVQIKSGRILLPFCRNNSDVFISHSDDDGSSWTYPRKIKGVTQSHWTWIGTGPPASIQLKGSGRIVVPAYHTIIRFNGQLSHAHTMISDDGGETFYLGALQFGDAKHFCNEVQVAERPDGTIVANSRALLTHRIVSFSRDGGLTFPISRAIPELREPIDGCEGSMIVLKDGTLVYSGPATYGILRVNMTIFKSLDGGMSWNMWRQIDSGNAGYSSMSVLPNGSVAILYESSKEENIVMLPDRIVFYAMQRNTSRIDESKAEKKKVPVF